MYRTELSRVEFHTELNVLSSKIEDNLEKENVKIDRLIREGLITTDMASSLVNDHDNVKILMEKLIEVAQILYTSKDPLLNEIQEGVNHMNTAA